MAERTTIARPYAAAAFNVAKQEGAFKQWSEMLLLAAYITGYPDVIGLLGDPRIARADVVSLVRDIAGTKFSETMQNLVAVLGENRRLACLADIAAQYEALRAEAERTVEAKVYSAYPLGEAEKQHLAGSLAKRLGRTVTLVCEIDTSLIGGAIIRAGDLVIDGSVRGQVDRLAVVLAH